MDERDVEPHQVEPQQVEPQQVEPRQVEPHEVDGRWGTHTLSCVHESAPGAPAEVAAGAAMSRDDGYHSTDDVAAGLRATGGRMTATRRATIDVLMANGDSHMNAEDVVAEVRSRFPDVAESTIYRNLGALEDLGVITHLHLGHGRSTFHLSHQDHRHLVCRRCEAVVEVPNHEFAALSERLEHVYGFAVAPEHFATVGDCRACTAHD